MKTAREWMAEEGEKLPPSIFEPPPPSSGFGFGSGLFAGASSTLLIGVGLAGFGLYFANKKGWLG